MSKRQEQTARNSKFLSMSQTIGCEFSGKYKEVFRTFPKSIRVYLNTLAGAGILKRKVNKNTHKNSSSSEFDDFDQSSFSSSAKSGSLNDINALLDSREGLVEDLLALLKHAESDDVNPAELVLEAKNSIVSLIGLINDRRKNLETAVIADVDPIVAAVASNVVKALQVTEVSIHDAVTAEHEAVIYNDGEITRPYKIIPIIEESAPDKFLPVVELTEPIFFQDLKGARVADQKLIETAPQLVVPDFVINTDGVGDQKKSPEDTEPPKDFD